MTTAEHTAADGGPVLIDAFGHPMVAAALARLAGSGGWARILAGKPLESEMDQADADLLVSAKVIEPDENRYVVLRKESFLRNPEELARCMIANLQRALQHARGVTGEWSGDDLELVLNQGRGSAGAGDLIADDLLLSLPQAQAACTSGHGRFLDVGTGVAAISQRLCERFPGLTCVGIDVLPHVLEVARGEVGTAGLTDRIEVRHQSVDELDDVAVYDLAWVPQLFIPRGAFVRGLARVFTALRSGGGLIVPTLAPPQIADEMEEAVLVHSGHVMGGGPITLSDACRLLADAGFLDVRHHDYGGQVILTAVRP